MAPCFESSYQLLLMAPRRLISVSCMRVAACQIPRWCLNNEASRSNRRTAAHQLTLLRVSDNKLP